MKSRLTRVSVGRDGYAMYRCKCGTVGRFNNDHVRSGHTKSCGCLQRELIAARQTTHGSYFEPEHQTWRNMIKRCDANPSYDGIEVHPRWRDSYKTFRAYLRRYLGDRPTKQHSLDRIDTTGHYVPGNIRWATKTVQSRNTNHATGRTGVRGVQFDRDRNLFAARITVLNKTVHLGRYPTLDEARQARIDGERKYWTEK